MTEPIFDKWGNEIGQINTATNDGGEGLIALFLGAIVAAFVICIAGLFKIIIWSFRAAFSRSSSVVKRLCGILLLVALPTIVLTFSSVVAFYFNQQQELTENSVEYSKWLSNNYQTAITFKRLGAGPVMDCFDFRCSGSSGLSSTLTGKYLLTNKSKITIYWNDMTGDGWDCRYDDTFPNTDIEAGQSRKFICQENGRDGGSTNDVLNCVEISSYWGKIGQVCTPDP